MAIDYDTLAPEHQEYVAKMFGQAAQRITVEKPKRPAKERGVPNQLEQDFADHCTLKLDYESITFHLARGCKFTPDWATVHEGRLVLIEVKGSSKNPTIQSRYGASMAKLRIAAHRYPLITFYLAKKDDAGAWQVYPVKVNCISRKPVEVAWLNGGA